MIIYWASSYICYFLLLCTMRMKPQNSNSVEMACIDRVGTLSSRIAWIDRVCWIDPKLLFTHNAVETAMCTSRPIFVTSRPIFVTSRPWVVISRSIFVISQTRHYNSRPRDVISRSIFVISQTRHYTSRPIFVISRPIFVISQTRHYNSRPRVVISWPRDAISQTRHYNSQPRDVISRPRDANARLRDIISGCHRLFCQAGIIPSMPLHETRAPLINRYLVLAIELLPWGLADRINSLSDDNMNAANCLEVIIYLYRGEYLHKLYVFNTRQMYW